MPLLIDGYNLMHAAGVASAGQGRSSLERSRLGLLNFLATHLDLLDKDRAVTIVFDAAGAPPGLPQRLDYRGLDVRFAKGYGTADDLLEELIRADSSPRKLTVVSSDHRVQRAARRRRAATLDADVWYERVTQAGRQRQQRDVSHSESRKPQTKLGDSDIEYWLGQFTEEKSSSTPGPFSDDYLQSVAEEFARDERRRRKDKETEGQ